jgi:uncharacterized membrane-anchored protein YitT (DUF2179 family)
VKRERILQVFVGLLGLLYLWTIYPLYTDLWHSKWLLEMHNECEPMFLSWFIALAPFLLLAARKPSSHRFLITFAACQCLVHASVMAVQTAEAWKHGVHRQFGDVVLVAVIGGILLALLPPRREQSAAVPQ